jgi:protoporphyrinogen/coproporphyrinogen III oxidase
MTRIAIIGGGISGLSAAFALEEHRRTGADVEYVLYEGSSRLGGVLRTEHIDGCTVEAGPDSFLTEKPWAADLARAVGLGDQMIGSNDAERKTYILVRGRLVPIPDGLMFMVPTKVLPMGMSPLFSWKTKLRMSQELFLKPHAHDHDESVAAFVERHYGAEMVDRLADPLLSGIYGGNAANLSVRAVLPRFAEMERTYGSLGRAMLSARKETAAVPNKTASSVSTSAIISKPTSIFTSFKNGMQQLAEAVVSQLTPTSLLTNAPVQAIQKEANSWVVSAGLQSDSFDGVVLALPAGTAAQVVRLANHELAAELAAVPYTSSIIVGLGYNHEVRKSLPPGFGFLVPRSEGRRLLAATFVHNKFPQRAPEDRALLRCFFAGSNAESLWPFSDEQIISIARNELQQVLGSHMGLHTEPLFARVYRWKSAMAQYTVGHLDRIDRIERLRQQLHGITLAGNAYRGIGVPDCVRSGREAALELLQR